MKVEIGLRELELDEAASVLTDAFAEYPLEMSFTADSLRRVGEADAVVFDACALARGPDSRLLGVGLAALRGSVGRIAAMGVVRRGQARGIGFALGNAVMSSLREAGARLVVLEALTVNQPALGLYETKLGFRRRRRLIGFTRGAGNEPIEQRQWDAALAAGDEPDSWQLVRVVKAIRATPEFTDVPAVIPESHAVARLLRENGFTEAEIDQYELERPL